MGEPAGRGRVEPVRGRVPRSGQHRAAGPLTPAGRRRAGAGRRDRLDGVPRAVDGDHRCLLSRGGRPTADLVLKFLEHFAAIRTAIGRHGLWDDTDGLFYDRLVAPDGTAVPVKVRSMVGIIPMPAAGVIDEAMLDRAQQVGKSFPRFLAREGLLDREKLAELGLLRGTPGHRGMLLGVVGIDRLERLFAKLFDEDEFLSAHGLRAMSAYHREHPYELEVEGVRAGIDYEPAESTTAMFGGNSNWRGPVWFPLNYMVINSWSPTTGSSETTTRSSTRPGPAGSCRSGRSSRTCASAWCRSSPSVPTDGVRASGASSGCRTTRPGGTIWCSASTSKATTRRGSGAAHQTGWTGLVADLIRRRHGQVHSIGDVLRASGPEGRRA